MPRRAEPPLTFRWPDPRDVSLALPATILISGVAHAAVFFLFRVAAPPGQPPFPPPPVEITLLAPGLPGTGEALEWIAARDPIRESRISDVLPANILQPAYSPSFARFRSTPDMVYAEPPVAGAPDIPALPARSRPVPAGDPPAPSPPSASRLTLSPAFAARKLLWTPPLDLTHPARETLVPARFLAGVGPEGRIELVYLLASCGNPQIDAYAERHLRSLLFDAIEEGGGNAATLWGEALFEFGADAYALEPAGTAR